VEETLRAGSALFAGSGVARSRATARGPKGGRYAQIDAFGGLLRLRSPILSPAVLPPAGSCTQLLPSGSVLLRAPHSQYRRTALPLGDSPSAQCTSLSHLGGRSPDGGSKSPRTRQPSPLSRVRSFSSPLCWSRGRPQGLPRESTSGLGSPIGSAERRPQHSRGIAHRITASPVHLMFRP
jgi:hypothetical protein